MSAALFHGRSLVGTHCEPSSPVSSLTLDLLGYIIHLALPAWPGLTNRDTLRYLAIKALQTSHVNRQWREAALTEPRIWLGPVLSWSLYSSSAEFFRTIIKRSAPLVLDLVIPSELKPEIYPEVMEAIRIQGDRTRSLHVHLSPAPPASVTMRLDDSELLVQQQRYRVMAKLPSRLRNVYPSQQSLPKDSKAVASQPYKGISNNVFPSLKDLTPDQQYFAPMAILMDCVRDSQTLEVLRVTGQPDDEFPIDIPRIVTLNKGPCYLPNLKELSVTASLYTCSSLVRNIVVSPKCALLLTCYDVRPNYHLTEVLLRMQHSLVKWECEADSQSDGRQTLHVSATHFGFTLEGPRSISSWMRTNTCIHPNVRLVLDWRHSKSPLDDLNTVIPTMLSLFTPRRGRNWPTMFCVDANSSIPIKRVVRGPILEWLVDQPLIQGLEFRTYDALVLLEPLFRMRNHPRAITNQVVPSLCDLVFYELSYTSSIQKTWRRLMRGLKRRSKARCAAMQVEFIGCRRDAELRGMEDMFEKLVNMVKCYADEVLVDSEYQEEYDATLEDEDMEDTIDTNSTVHQDSDIEYR